MLHFLSPSFLSPTQFQMLHDFFSITIQTIFLLGCLATTLFPSPQQPFRFRPQFFTATIAFSCFIVLNKQHLIFSQPKFFKADWVRILSRWFTWQHFSGKVCYYVKVIRTVHMAKCEIIQVLKNEEESITYLWLKLSTYMKQKSNRKILNR